MNVGLPYITQIRGDEERAGAGNPTDPTHGVLNLLRGFVALTFTQIVAAITAGYHREHNTDDTHSTIHATGAIYERGRTTALGTLTSLPFDASLYAGNGTMTWVPTEANTFIRFTRVGTLMFVTFYIANTTVGGALNTQLIMRFPTSFPKAAALVVNQVRLIDNAARVAGDVTVDQGTNALIVQRADGANFAASAAATSVFGEVFYEVV